MAGALLGQETREERPERSEASRFSLARGDEGPLFRERFDSVDDPARRLGGTERQRRQQVRIAARQADPARQDANHLVAFAAEPKQPPDRPRIATESVMPQPFAEHHPVR